MHRLYPMVASRLPRWPLDLLLRRKTRSAAQEPQRIAYVIWQYPELSQTFVVREVEALLDAGLLMQVFAHSPPEGPSGAMHRVAGHTVYYGPVVAGEASASLRARARRAPLLLFLLWLHVIRSSVGVGAGWWLNREVMLEAAQLADVLAAHGITHVHAVWGDRRALVAFVASRLVGATCSAQVRASELHRHARYVAVAERIRYMEFVITNSRYNERFLRDCLPVASSPPMHIVYDGIPLAQFEPGQRTQRREGPFRILAVARLVEPKGLRYLLQACHILRERGHAFACEIIGGPNDPGDTVVWLELRMLQMKYDLEELVTLRGAQDFAVVLDAMREADVFVLPCVRGRDGSHDITPNSIIEAMAMKVPVVSTTSGAIPEMIDDGVDGILVPPNDAVEIADAIERLMSDPGRARALGAAGRTKVETRFDIAEGVLVRRALFDALAVTERG